MYKLHKNSFGSIGSVIRLSDTTFIPFDPANTDYQKFKTDVFGGAELQDADGVPMSPDAAQAFIATLP